MYIDDHILYHGAVMSVPEPLAHVGRPDLDFIALSRKGLQPWKGFDWIEGGIANDRVISTVDAYIDGAMTAEKAMGELIKEDLRHQVCILNQEIIDKYLTFVESVEL